MREMAARRNVNGVLLPIVYGTVRGDMDTWDADKLYGCTCDGQPWLEGGSDANGTDCFERGCPRGDDLNTEQRDEVQTVFCSATGGTFTLTFRGMETRSIPFDAKNMGEWQSLGTGTITRYSAVIASTSSDFSSKISIGSILNVYSNSGTDTRNYTVASVSSSTVTLTEPIGMNTETGVLVR
jgi:hypothetical protein